MPYTVGAGRYPPLRRRRPDARNVILNSIEHPGSAVTLARKSFRSWWPVEVRSRRTIQPVAACADDWEDIGGSWIKFRMATMSRMTVLTLRPGTSVIAEPGGASTVPTTWSINVHPW